MKKNLIFALVMLIIPTMHGSLSLSDEEPFTYKKRPKKCSSYSTTQRLNQLCKEIDRIEKKGFAKRSPKPMDTEWQGTYGYASQNLTVGGLVVPTDSTKKWSKLYGYAPSDNSVQTPTAFDIRQLLGDPDNLNGIFAVQNQETFENCVANALTANLQFDWYVVTVLKQVNEFTAQNEKKGMTKEEARKQAFLDIKPFLPEYDKPFSRLFLWYNAKGGNTKNIGISIADAIYAFSGDPDAIPNMQPFPKKGCCLRKTWQYTKENAQTEPNEAAAAEALQYQVHKDTIGAVVSDLDFANLNSCTPRQKLDDIKMALRSNRRGVLVGLFFADQKAVENFAHLTPPYIIADPSGKDAGPNQYGHCMLIVGYNDKKELFTLRNSYGPYWGDNGYCYASYNLIISDWVQDLWTMKRIKN